MEEKTWLDHLVTIGSLVTPILLVLLSAIGWRFKNKIERRVELENRLHDDRAEIYNQILEPFILILIPDAAWEMNKKNKNKDKTEMAIQIMYSLEYRKQGFNLSLMGPDSVVVAYNNLMQYFYNAEEEKKSGNNEFIREMLVLLGTFLLEIRRSMGNEATKLDNWDMCEWWMSDARKIKRVEYSA